MLTMNIILILLCCLSLSFQTIKSGLFCDDQIKEIYVYDERLGFYKYLQSVKNPVNCWNVDYVDLDVDPGALIKFKCYNAETLTLGGGCFLINNRCLCYNFENTEGYGYDYNQLGNSFSVNFNNGIRCSHYTRYLKTQRKGDYYYYHYVPLDVDEIKCNPKTILAPINSTRSLKFSDFIESPFKVTNLNISIAKNYQIFTLNNQQLLSNTKFNILSDIEYFSNQSRKINIQFINYGVEIDNNKKTCELNIRFCYDSCEECYDFEPNEASHQCSKCKADFYFIENTTNCMTINQMKDNHSYYFDRKEKIFRTCYDSCEECYDIEPNETSHQCSKCKDDFYFIENTISCKTIKEMENSSYYFDINETIFRLCYDRCEKCNDKPNETSHQCSDCKENYYFIENTSNCMTIKEMENSSYYFDNNETIFRHCLNGCLTCDSETSCSKCSEDYHFIYNEKGKCIREPKSDDLLYLDDKTNTYIKCPEGTGKVENNICIQKSYLAVIVISSIVFIIIIIGLFFFIKKIISNKKNESEIPITFGKNTADNQLINVFL